MFIACAIAYLVIGVPFLLFYRYVLCPNLSSWMEERMTYASVVDGPEFGWFLKPDAPALPTVLFDLFERPSFILHLPYEGRRKESAIVLLLWWILIPRVVVGIVLLVFHGFSRLLPSSSPTGKLS